MSFAASVKNEICKADNAKPCCRLSELKAALAAGGSVSAIGPDLYSLKVITENASFARRLFTYINEITGIRPDVVIEKNPRLRKHAVYTVIADLNASCAADLLNGRASASGSKSRRVCCAKAFLRGAFLGGGSVSDPGKAYHLEIKSHNRSFIDEVIAILRRFEIGAKVIRRRGSNVLYIKEGEDVVDFLNIIGAHSCLFDMENIRAMKEMRNSVNRIVNCETANLGKTVNAALVQVENMKLIKQFSGFDNLPGGLKQTAELRIRYPDADLKELGSLHEPPLGKSGVCHRLRKLNEIAAQVRLNQKFDKK